MFKKYLQSDSGEVSAVSGIVVSGLLIAGVFVAFALIYGTKMTSVFTPFIDKF